MDAPISHPGAPFKKDWRILRGYVRCWPFLISQSWVRGCLAGFMLSLIEKWNQDLEIVENIEVFKYLAKIIIRYSQKKKVQVEKNIH